MSHSLVTLFLYLLLEDSAELIVLNTWESIHGKRSLSLRYMFWYSFNSSLSVVLYLFTVKIHKELMHFSLSSQRIKS